MTVSRGFLSLTFLLSRVQSESCLKSEVQLRSMSVMLAGVALLVGLPLFRKII